MMSARAMLPTSIRRCATFALSFILAVGAIASAGVGVAVAQSLNQPARGSELRSAVLAAARPIFEQETGGQVEFLVRRLNVIDNWAFGDVTLQRPGGRPIEWRRTKFAEAIAIGAFDPAGSFFLARRTAQGWQVIAFVTGPTDIAWDGWDKVYGAPRAIFERGF